MCGVWCVCEQPVYGVQSARLCYVVMRYVEFCGGGFRCVGFNS